MQFLEDFDSELQSDNMLIKKSLNFRFKYEAIIVGHIFAKEVTKKIVCQNDSRLTVGHLMGEYQLNNAWLL